MWRLTPSVPVLCWPRGCIPVIARFKSTLSRSFSVIPASGCCSLVCHFLNTTSPSLVDPLGEIVNWPPDSRCLTEYSFVFDSGCVGMCMVLTHGVSPLVRHQRCCSVATIVFFCFIEFVVPVDVAGFWVRFQLPWGACCPVLVHSMSIIPCRSILSLFLWPIIACANNRSGCEYRPIVLSVHAFAISVALPGCCLLYVHRLNSMIILSNASCQGLTFRFPFTTLTFV